MSKWQRVIDSPGGFAMSGVYINDKLHLGSYGDGHIYSWLPLVTELANSGEAVLGMAVFKGQIYATSENNDMAGQRTRVLKRTNVGWVESGSLKGYASYFMCVWGNYLVVTTTSDLQSIDYWYSPDGANWTHGAHFNDWLWVPAVFRNELYFLGHGGPAGGPGQSKAVKWTGSGWSDVPALCGPCLEWQCATEHGGKLYLGGGGWTLGRGTSQATVYAFDGQTCQAVKHDQRFHEVQALLSSKINGYLYASFGAGFKADNGGSQLWASLDGKDWLNAGAFDCPQLYTLLDTPYGFIAAGGAQGRLAVYYFDTQAPVTPPPPVYEHECPKCEFQF